MMTDPAASRPGTHLDPDQMADLFDGLLDPVATENARAHLATCALCSADYALITGETELSDLGDLLPTPPIPHDVMARVEAALYREPPLAVAPVSSAPAGHHAAAPPRRQWLRLAGALAGATLVFGGGIGVITALNGGGDSVKRDSTAASGAAPSPQSDSTQSAGRPQGGMMSPQVGGAPDSSTAGSQQSADASIQQQAHDLLKQHPALPATGTTKASGPQCSPAGLVDGSRLVGSAQTQYQGEPAVLLVYAEPGNTTVADVYVVDRNSCTPGDTGQVLYQVSIPRP